MKTNYLVLFILLLLCTSCGPQSHKAVLYYGNGIFEYQIKNYVSAVNYFDSALYINPYYLKALWYKNKSMLEIKYLRDTLELLNAKIKKNPNDTDAFSDRGLLKLKLHDYLGAIRDFDTILKMDPKDATTYLQRSVAKQQLKDFDGAELDYKMGDTLLKAQLSK